jgi:hypothetical protein
MNPVTSIAARQIRDRLAGHLSPVPTIGFNRRKLEDQRRAERLQ